MFAHPNRRMKEGAGLCARNREQRVLMMVFGHNKSKIPADRFPEFPDMSRRRRTSAKAGCRRDDETLRKRLDDRQLFWLKVFLVMTFKYGFRKGELLKAKCSYFDRSASTFTLPAFTTKNSMERVVDVAPGGEIHMLVALTDGRAHLTRHCSRGTEGRCAISVASGRRANGRHQRRVGQEPLRHHSRPTPERNHEHVGEGR